MRKFQQLRSEIASDLDFRSLSAHAQLLYHLVLTDPTLSYCGVLDWRPHRIAQRVSDWDTQSVVQAGEELVSRFYLVIDTDTEEALIRSYLRNSGSMDNKNLGTACARAYSAVASTVILGVLTDELHRLKHDCPTLLGLTSPEWERAWNNPRVSAKELPREPSPQIGNKSIPTDDSNPRAPKAVDHTATPDQWSTPEDPRCREHANLPRSAVPACHRCAAARKWFTEQQEAHLRARQRAIEACPLCDSRGLISVEAGDRKVAIRCSHTTPPTPNEIQQLTRKRFMPASNKAVRADALEVVRKSIPERQRTQL